MVLSSLRLWIGFWSEFVTLLKHVSRTNPHNASSFTKLYPKSLRYFPSSWNTFDRLFGTYTVKLMFVGAVIRPSSRGLPGTYFNLIKACILLSFLSKKYRVRRYRYMYEECTIGYDSFSCRRWTEACRLLRQLQLAKPTNLLQMNSLAPKGYDIHVLSYGLPPQPDSSRSAN